MACRAAFPLASGSLLRTVPVGACLTCYLPLSRMTQKSRSCASGPCYGLPVIQPLPGRARSLSAADTACGFLG